MSPAASFSTSSFFSSEMSFVVSVFLSCSVMRSRCSMEVVVAPASCLCELLALARRAP